MSTRLTIAPYDYARLPVVAREEFELRFAHVREIGAKDAAYKDAIAWACRAIAERTENTKHAKTYRQLRRLYKAFLHIGDSALIDHRICGGCGLGTCPAAKTKQSA